MSMLIGFTGLKGSGKDTAAQVLVKDFEFVRLAFADKLKESVSRLFDIDLENVDKWKDSRTLVGNFKADGIPAVEIIIDVEGHAQYSYSWREFLQRFGTEMGREVFGQDFWVDQWLNVYYEYRAMERNVVATDVRFPNEAHAIRAMGGVVVEITRPGHVPDGHVSEEPLPRSWIDAQIANNGSIEALAVDVYDLYKALERK